MKLLIAVQFHSGDRATAMRLARFLADIEPVARDDIEILFVARFDAEHDHDTMRYVALKFDVTWITTHTRWIGWPGGCNGCAIDTLQWVATNRKSAGGVLMLEPDCVPTSKRWIRRLKSRWQDAIEAQKWLMGAWRPSGGEHGHINGVAVYRADFANLAHLDQVVSQDLAWDCGTAPYVKEHWVKSDIIRNCFQSTDATQEKMLGPISGEMPAVVHGFKDDSAYDIARRLCGLTNDPVMWRGEKVSDLPDFPK